MRRLPIALLLIVAYGGAVAAQQGEPGRGDHYDGRGHGKASVRVLAAQLPGGYALVPRLGLSDEQKEVLALLHERDDKILERYTTFAESVDAVIPPPRGKAGMIGHPYVHDVGGQGRPNVRVRIRPHN
ncbi:MAG: hypothetical protein ACOC8E_05855 [Planctomycetota bacterium]